MSVDEIKKSAEDRLQATGIFQTTATLRSALTSRSEVEVQGGPRRR